MVIIDTDIITKCLQNDVPVRKEITDLLENKAAAITPIQIAEIHSLTRSEEIALVDKFLELFQRLDLNHEAASLAGRYFSQYQKYYQQLSLNDCFIAAIAASEGYEIFTNRPENYPMTEVQLYHKTIKAITLRSKSRLANINE